MNPFNKRAAARIAIASILLAAVASPLAWFVARENAEQNTVSMAMEESRRVLRHYGAMPQSGADADAHARKAADTLAGGLFDIAEIYDRDGNILAATLTEEGMTVEVLLHEHRPPTYTTASHESTVLKDKRWILRVFVPLRDATSSDPSQVNGYFEGVRIIPDWQRKQMMQRALSTALMVSLASLLCGLVIYPVVVHLSADNERKTHEILDSHLSLLETLGRTIAQRDSNTGAHNYRVAWIAVRIGENLGLKGKIMQSLIAGSFLHDIGKVSIPDIILRKPGKLDAAETEVMHTHVEHGQEILDGIEWLDEASDVVTGHHEKWDGSGYPYRIAGESIPLSARIFTVADVFDALCSQRPYKEPMNYEAAMALMEKETGSHFDPEVMAAFRPIAREIFNRITKCTDEDARYMLEERIRLYFGV